MRSDDAHPATAERRGPDRPVAPPLEERDPAAAGAVLPTIECGKFTAHLDAFAWAPGRVQRQRDFSFLSLVGSQVALRALWARLLKGELSTVLPDGPLGRASFATLGPEGAGGWRAHTAVLPSAGGHQLALFPASSFFLAERDDFVLIPPPRGSARGVPLPTAPLPLPQSPDRSAAAPDLGRLALGARAAAGRGYAAGDLRPGRPGLPLRAEPRAAARRHLGRRRIRRADRRPAGGDARADVGGVTDRNKRPCQA